MRNGNFCILTNIKTKKTRGSMVQLHSYSTRQAEILWQFFILMELELFLYYFLITKKMNLSNEKQKQCSWTNIQPEKYQSLYGTMICISHMMGGKRLWQLFIFVEIEPFFYYCMITKTPDIGNMKQKLVQLDQYLPIKISKALEATMSILCETGENNCSNYSYLWSWSHFPTILLSP